MSTRDDAMMLSGEGASESGGVILGLTWEAGDLDCDFCALVVNQDRKALSDGHFVFWSAKSTPDRTVFLRSQSAPVDPSRDRAQLLVDLASLPATANRIVLTMSTIVDGANLSSMQWVRLVAVDPCRGEKVAQIDLSPQIKDETLLVLAEVARDGAGWELRRVGTPYSAGLAGFLSDHGVDVD